MEGWETTWKREIYLFNGDYYIGEFKEGRMVIMVKELDREHTTKDGDKYTGIWDGDKGQGEVNYKDGKKYIGQWDGD